MIIELRQGPHFVPGIPHVVCCSLSLSLLTLSQARLSADGMQLHCTGSMRPEGGRWAAGTASLYGAVGSQRRFTLGRRIQVSVRLASGDGCGCDAARPPPTPFPPFHPPPPPF